MTIYKVFMSLNVITIREVFKQKSKSSVRIKALQRFSKIALIGKLKLTSTPSTAV